MKVTVVYKNLESKTPGKEKDPGELMNIRSQLINDVSWGSGSSDFPAVKKACKLSATWEDYRPKVSLISEDAPRSFKLEFPGNFFNFESEGVNHFIGTVAGDIILNRNIKEIVVDDFYFDEKDNNEREKYFPGPNLGIKGVYGLFNNQPQRPLLAYSIKPRMGFSIDEFKAILNAAKSGGVDIIEDDERMIDPKYCSFSERIKAAKECLGNDTNTLYSANITGPVDAMKKRVREAYENNIHLVKVDVLVTGFDALREIAVYIKEKQYILDSKNKDKKPEEQITIDKIDDEDRNYKLGITVFPDVIGRYRNLSRTFILKMARLCGADIIYAGSPGWSRDAVFSNSLIHDCEKVYLRHKMLRDQEKDMAGVNQTLATMTNDISAQSAQIITLLFNSCFSHKKFAFFIGHGISSADDITAEIKDIIKRITQAAGNDSERYIIDKIRQSCDVDDYSQCDWELYVRKYLKGY